MTCKNCFHCNVCEVRANLGDITENAEGCKNFIDNSRVIVPPCKVGDKVYVISNSRVKEAEITIIDRDVKIGDKLNLVAFADAMKNTVTEYFEGLVDDYILDHEKIKVQLFLHEKEENKQNQSERLVSDTE